MNEDFINQDSIFLNHYLNDIIKKLYNAILIKLNFHVPICSRLINFVLSHNYIKNCMLYITSQKSKKASNDDHMETNFS